MQIRSFSCSKFLSFLFLAFFMAFLSLPVLAKSGSAVASWYGPGFHGKKTANGERYNQWGLTTAHNSLPFGTLVTVSHKGKSVTVRVTDRGGFHKYGRQFDLSRGAAKRIGCDGVCKIQYNVVWYPVKEPYKAKRKRSGKTRA